MTSAHLDSVRIKPGDVLASRVAVQAQADRLCSRPGNGVSLQVPRMIRVRNCDLDESGQAWRPRAAEIAKVLRAQCAATAMRHRLGDEDSLSTGLCVSKRTLRLAVRELEREGIIKVQRGRGGGIFAVRKPLSQASQMLADQLAKEALPIRDIKAAANILFRIAVIHAGRNNDSSRDALLDRANSIIEARRTNNLHLDVDAWSETRRIIVEASGMLLLSIFHDALQSAYRDVLAADLRIGIRADAEGIALLEMESGLIRAIQERAVGEVRRLVKVLNNTELQFLDSSLANRAISPTLRPQFLYDRSSRIKKTDGKLAHQTLRALHVHVDQARLHPKQRLGTLPELAARFGVGLDVMREAIQLGCQQKLVWNKRGRGGGIFVARGASSDFVQDEIATMTAMRCGRSDVIHMTRLLRHRAMPRSAAGMCSQILQRMEFSQ